MTSSSYRQIISLIALLLMSASCGPSPQAGGGIGGTGNTATVVSGPITNTSPNNVSVSGYDYNTSSTAMTVDGTSGTQTDLKNGMVVLLKATLTHNYGTNDPPQRTANTLVYEDTIEGVVQAVASDGSSLVVLGQTVSITSSTIVDTSVPGQNVLRLVSGRDLLEVSGFVTGDGTVVGTFIALKTGTPDYEVKGFIKNHDAARGTFGIGALSVDYRDADVHDLPNPSASSWNGLLVDVRGSHVSSGGSGQYGVRLTATKVKPVGLGVENSEGSEIEGFVTLVLGQGDFYLGNVHVQTSGSTSFEGGTLNDILVGARLEVEGPLVSGVVNATKVEFEGETELQANVDAVNPSDSTLTLTGLTGLMIQFDSHTRLDGQGSPRHLDDLHSGDHLSIHGRLQGGNVILATEVERSAPKSNVQVQGLVTSAIDPIIVLLGASIDTSSIPESGFQGRYGAIGRSAFFIGLSNGNKVSVQGNVVNAAIAWTKATRKG